MYLILLNTKGGIEKSDDLRMNGIYVINTSLLKIVIIQWK